MFYINLLKRNIPVNDFFCFKQSLKRPKIRIWFVLDNFVFLSHFLSKTAHYAMYIYVYILTIYAIRLYVFDLTTGHNGLVICVHVCLCVVL